MLPNGDVLVVESKSPGIEPVRRRKDMVMHFIESRATSGGGKQKSNRITLIHYGADGAPQTRSVFLDNLFSPFGVALVGNDLYVANTDAIVRYPYNPGDTKISAPGTVLTPLPGGPIDHHWTKSLVASRDGARLTWAWDRTATSPKRACRRKRIARPSGRSIARPAAGASSRAACATRMG